MILDELAAVCAFGRGGYTGDTGHESVTTGDFNGDGVQDYFIDSRKVQCARGEPTGDVFDAILMVSGSGSFQKVVTARAHDATVERNGDNAVLYLELSGQPCGRAPAQQHCRNRMDWRPDLGQFVYGETLYIDAQGGLSARPAYPQMDAALPAEFARGAFSLGRGPRGGCDRFYRDHRAALTAAYNGNDANTMARITTEQDCDTDLAWFMLGRAAELFGLDDAAFAYYDRAIRRHNQITLSLHSSCVLSSLGACWGLNLPQEAQAGMTRTRAR